MVGYWLVMSINVTIKMEAIKQSNSKCQLGNEKYWILQKDVM